MNRRFFLSSLAGAAAAAASMTLDPERLLWVPGTKHISIPAPPKVFVVEGRWETLAASWGVYDDYTFSKWAVRAMRSPTAWSKWS